MLPRVGDHEPVSFLDQEMQELAQVLGDEGGVEGDLGGGGTVAAGSESQPYLGSRRGRRRARRSGRLRVDKLVRVPLPLPVPVAYHSFGGWKRSLFGDLHAYGPDAVRFYTKRKTITQRWPSAGVREGTVFSFPSNR